MEKLRFSFNYTYLFLIVIAISILNKDWILLSQTLCEQDSSVNLPIQTDSTPTYNNKLITWWNSLTNENQALIIVSTIALGYAIPFIIYPMLIEMSIREPSTIITDPVLIKFVENTPDLTRSTITINVPPIGEIFTSAVPNTNTIPLNNNTAIEAQARNMLNDLQAFTAEDIQVLQNNSSAELLARRLAESQPIDNTVQVTFT